MDPEELRVLSAEIDATLGDNIAVNALIEAYPSFKEKIENFSKLVAEEVKICEETPQKRSLYSDIELLRIDWNNLVFNERMESLNTKINKIKDQNSIECLQKLTKSEPYKISNEIYSRFDEFRQLLRIELVGTSKFRRFLHALIFAVYIFFISQVCIITSPVQLLDPILRKRGWKTRDLPVEVIQRWFCSSTLYWCGVEVYWEGRENVDPDKSYIQMYSHASSYDAFTLCTGPSPIRLFGKKSIFMIPILGWHGYLTQHYILDRNNLESAKKSIDNAVKDISKKQRTLAIAPEGTRSRCGRLTDFKKGAFHMALQAKEMPISPILLMNHGMFWGGSQWTPAPGRVYLRALPEVNILPGETYKQLRDRIHKLFLIEYKKPIGKTVDANNDLINFLSLPFCYYFVTYFWSGVGTLIGSIFG